MRTLLFGSSGLLGQALIRRWPMETLIGLTSRDVDIRNARDVLPIVEKLHPDCIILSAAYTDVDGCETNRDRAFATNRDGALNVARAAAKTGSRLLFLSTDYVFDGTNQTPYEISDSRNPQTVYGQSKSEAELGLLQVLPDCCIVRTSWLFGIGGRCFPDSILKAAATRPELDVVSDQFGCPTHSSDLADAIVRLCQRQASGIVHVTNDGACSWFDFAREILKRAESKTIVRPISSESLARPAKRPKYSVLSSTSRQKYQIVMPRWEQALEQYVAERSV